MKLAFTLLWGLFTRSHTTSEDLQHQVAWAAYAESVILKVQKKRDMWENKIKRWRILNGPLHMNQTNSAGMSQGGDIFDTKHFGMNSQGADAIDVKQVVEKVWDPSGRIE